MMIIIIIVYNDLEALTIIVLFDMEKALVVWLEDQTNHYRSLSRSLAQSKTPPSFSHMKAHRSEEAE